MDALALQPIRVSPAIETFMMGPNDRSHGPEVMNKANQFLAKNRVLLDQCSLGLIECFRLHLPTFDQLSRHAHQPYVMQESAEFQNLPVRR